MKSDKTTVWLDVTDLQCWSGHLTGVQRVIYEVLVELIADSELDARGFAYEPSRNDIFEVGLRTLADKFSSQQTSLSESSQTNLTAKLRLAYLKLPNRIKHHITSRHKEYIRKTGRLSLRALRYLKQTIKPSTTAVAKAKKAEISKQDTVLVLGKVWDSTPLVDLLSNLKKQVGFRYVQAVHDLIPIFEPHLFGEGLFDPYAQYLFETVAAADVILCVSKSTQKDILRFANDLNFPKPHTVIIEHGDSPLNSVKSQLPNFVKETEPFILSVGTVEARKNHRLLYQAWKLADERGVELPRLIIVGAPGWLAGETVYSIQHDPTTKDRISLRHNLPDTQLKWLYEHCLFTVYPSIYEGWGLPVAEALAFGKICIASKASSIPEIAGTMLDYISPYSADELLREVKKYLSLRLRRAKEQEIAAHYKKRGWRNTYLTIKRQLSWPVITAPER